MTTNWQCPQHGLTSPGQIVHNGRQYSCGRCGSRLLAVDAEHDRDIHRDEVMAWEKAMMSAIGEDGIRSVVEAIGKLKAERDQLREQNAALSAHVERCNKIIDSWGDCEISCDDAALWVADWRGDKPDTSLARIRAEAKAEAYEHAAMQLSMKHGPAIRRIRELAADSRQQAEGD